MDCNPPGSSVHGTFQAGVLEWGAIAFSIDCVDQNKLENSERDGNTRPPDLPPKESAEFTQTHVHQVSDATQPSHPLSSPSPPAPNPSQHQSLFQ